MVVNIIQMIFSMILPTAVLIYTISFARWMKRKNLSIGFLSAACIGVLSYLTTGVVIWRLFT